MFRFRLDRVYAWETSKCNLEEFKTGQASAFLSKANSALAHLRADYISGEQEAMAAPAIAGQDLHVLAMWRNVFRRKEAELELACRDWERKLFEQRARWVQARRRCRLLGNLRSRRLAEYEYETSRMDESAAAEAYLVRWSGAKTPHPGS
jgi:hypothetical protein